ncbi:hypothetical protein CRV02_13970 [Arcobacter sp. CECT 8989]|uniref:ORC-CDC6 family AAA ATPase n=1 Tax=Arcobacter sp. CECT 8989 TaxID=2044509 RepID=UPI00100B82C0|nr:hypothetical protein [Arcobacter sp. CECT 8989]RXJ98129.1 hypothetical protein CRV02_13970 [Arcobacter sp. CECT 8989]
MTNPFSNIKAVHLNNDEIVNFWVELNDEINHKKFLDVIEPTNPRPLIILGGKGSGKTHILRYCSYSAQKVRAQKSIEHENCVLTQIKEDKYTSLLLELGNFQFERFSGSKLDKAVWEEWYFYYFNLILIEAFLEQIIDLQKNGLEDINLEKISNMYKEYFFDSEEVLITIDYIYRKIRQEHKKIDRAFSRLRTGFKNSLDLDVIFDTRSNIFYDISYYILEASDSLKDIRFLFLLDQFEDLSKEQQRFVNTILRHPKFSERISIRIAGRLYSIKEEKTFSDNEKNSYAEVTKKYLETYLDNSKNYKQFAINLIKKRLDRDISNLDEKYLTDSFLEFDKLEIIKKVLSIHPESKDRKYFLTLTKQLEQYSDSLNLSPKEIVIILNNLFCPSDPHKEKENIWLLYQAWSKNKNLVEKSQEIKNSMEGKFKNIHDNETLRHLSNTFYFQICREYSITFFNCGLEKIIDFSHANPRNFMLILSEIYANAKFSEETMFDNNNPIKCKTQDKAIKSASNEFWRYAIIDIEDKFVVRMVERINSFFKAFRMSNKPTEKTLIAFSYTGKVSEESEQILTKAVNHMLLIKKSISKKEKNNSGTMLDSYSVPAILTVKWDLHIATGGTFQFKAEDIELLCKGEDKDWLNVYKEYISRYNVPFNKGKKEQEETKAIPYTTPSLFGDTL